MPTDSKDFTSFADANAIYAVGRAEVAGALHPTPVGASVRGCGWSIAGREGIPPGAIQHACTSRFHLARNVAPVVVARAGR